MNRAVVETITLDGLNREGNHQKWQTLVQQFALSARRFEAHCWEDETDAIALLPAYSEEVPRDWPHGRVFAGTVTPAFVQLLLTLPLPEAEDQLTPFFSIFFDNGFSSEHYGTEINICEEDVP